jgi:tight adherence protein C
MNTPQDTFLPIFFALLAGLVAGLLLKQIYSSRALRQSLAKRRRILSEFSTQNSDPRNRSRFQFEATKTVIDGYGNRIVKGTYKSRLEQMLLVSGDWENQNYSNLIRRKILFASIGFLLTFLFLLLRNLQALPIILALVVISYLLPNIDRSLRKFLGRKYLKKLEKLLDRAGSWDSSDYLLLIRRKVIFATGGFIVGYFYLIAQARTFTSMLTSMISILIGFFLPDVLLQNRVLKRKEAIANALPDAIDMLQMCVSAGLAFPAALSRVAETQSGPVSEEFSRVTTEVQLGKSRPEALAGMAERTQEKNVQKFVSAMQQVTTFGIPILNVLIEQSKEMRAMRREKARERAQKVPIKILAPIMLCFLPAVIVIVLGPAIVTLVTK